MPTVHVVMGAAMGAGAPVYAPTPRCAETLATSNESVLSQIRAVDGDYATIDAVDVTVYVAIGPSPSAVVGAGHIVVVGGRKDFGPLKNGDRVAVIHAQS